MRRVKRSQSAGFHHCKDALTTSATARRAADHGDSKSFVNASLDATSRVAVCTRTRGRRVTLTTLRPLSRTRSSSCTQRVSPLQDTTDASLSPTSSRGHIDELAARRSQTWHRRHFDNGFSHIGKKEQQDFVRRTDQVRPRSCDIRHVRSFESSQNIPDHKAILQAAQSMMTSIQRESIEPHALARSVRRREDSIRSRKLMACLPDILPVNNAVRRSALSLSPKKDGLESDGAWQRPKLGPSFSVEHHFESSFNSSCLNVNHSDLREQTKEEASRCTEEGAKNIQQLQNGQKIYDKYYWEEVLQESGSGGKVVVCQPKSASPEGQAFNYVMKIVSKEPLRRNRQMHDQFRKLYMRVLDLPQQANILPLHEVLEDEDFYYIVMEKANCGSLLHSLVNDFKDGCMPACAVQKVMQQILRGVGHLHKHGILHRDIKPDNIVMHTVGNQKHVMLIDFDHADPDWNPAEMERSTGLFGTLRFNAPEAFVGKFSPQSDLYSIGTILYLLMTGKFPFSEDVFVEESHLRASEQNSWAWRKSIYERMEKATIDFSCDPWPKQPACKELCQRLLEFAPEARLASAEEALGQSWLLTCDCETVCPGTVPEVSSTQ